MSGGFDEADAVAFLEVQGFAGPFRIKLLRGGYWNKVMRIDSAGGRFVLKRYVAVLPNSLFPNLPDQEAAALDRLKGRDVAPEPLGFWPDDGILVYRYVEGEPWSDDVAAVADLLRRKEHVPSAGFRAVPWQPEAILAEGDRLMARCHDDPLARRLRERRPAPAPIDPPAKLSMIHTDIGAGNLIGRGRNLRLIDWQCPAEGDLAEDVYSFLSPAFQLLNERPPLAPAAIDAFFTALDLSGMRDRYRRLRPCYAYRMAAYCCLRYQGAGEDRALHDRYHAAVTAELEALA
jgi:thiamine kinase